MLFYLLSFSLFKFMFKLQFYVFFCHLQWMRKNTHERLIFDTAAVAIVTVMHPENRKQHSSHIKFVLMLHFSVLVSTSRTMWLFCCLCSMMSTNWLLIYLSTCGVGQAMPWRVFWGLSIVVVNLFLQKNNCLVCHLNQNSNWRSWTAQMW